MSKIGLSARQHVSPANRLRSLPSCVHGGSILGSLRIERDSVTNSMGESHTHIILCRYHAYYWERQCRPIEAYHGSRLARLSMRSPTLRVPPCRNGRYAGSDTANAPEASAPSLKYRCGANGPSLPPCPAGEAYGYADWLNTSAGPTLCAGRPLKMTAKTFLNPTMTSMAPNPGMAALSSGG